MGKLDAVCSGISAHAMYYELKIHLPFKGYMLPRFTERGFDVVRTPAHIHAKLKKAVDEGIANWDNLREEEQVEDSIYGPYNPKFVELGGLAQEVIKELRSMHEAWGGMELRATSAYGVRLYRNGSSMVMHNDKVLMNIIYTPISKRSIVLACSHKPMLFLPSFILRTSTMTTTSPGPSR